MGPLPTTMLLPMLLPLQLPMPMLSATVPTLLPPPPWDGLILPMLVSAPMSVDSRLLARHEIEQDRSSTTQTNIDKPNQNKYRQMDGQMDGHTDGRTDRRTDRQ